MAEIDMIGSPKRKRSLEDEPGRALSPLRLRTDDGPAPQGSRTPRSHVADEFRSLRIQPEHPVSRLSFRGKAPEPTSPSPRCAPLTTTYNGPGDFLAHRSPSPRASTQRRQPLESHPPGSNEAGQQPATPLLNPVSPAGAPHTISPLGSAAQTPVRQSPSNSASPGDPPSPSPAGRTPQAARPKSPPPSAAISDLVWSDSEITGHDPNDPNDDGYGINGIGFAPTPAMAAQRSLKRRQQISDWKVRELRDARNRRAERRRGAGMDRAMSSGSLGDPGTSESSRKVVRFVGT